MMGSWTDASGWPVPYPAPLREAIAAIPGADQLSAARIDWFTGLIAAASASGRDEEMQRSRPASQKATDAQLARLHNLAKALADHINTLNRPAVAAMFGEGTNVFDVQLLVGRMQEDARGLWGARLVSEAAGQRKIEAAEVTAITAKVFEGVSGRRPTFTTDPVTSEVSGDWPRVLGLVFGALCIDASVASQVRALSEKRRTKNGAKLT